MNEWMKLLNLNKKTPLSQQAKRNWTHKYQIFVTEGKDICMYMSLKKRGGTLLEALNGTEKKRKLGYYPRILIQLQVGGAKKIRVFDTSYIPGVDAEAVDLRLYDDVDGLRFEVVDTYPVDEHWQIDMNKKKEIEDAIKEAEGYDKLD